MPPKNLPPPAPDDDDRTLPEYLLDVLLTPFRLLTSPSASRIYLRTALLVLTSLTLLFLSTLAYVIFYNQYIPSAGFTLPLHLQYSHDYGFNPYALAKIQVGLVKSRQGYDVAVRLCLPSIPQNVEAGNFMVEASVRGPETVTQPTSPTSNSEDEGKVELIAPVVATSARPALLHPEDALVTTTRRLLQLPLLVFGWKSESECLRIPVFEGVSFDKGWRNQPDVLRVEVAAQGGPSKTLRVQSASVEWEARFEGLRYWIRRWRVVSALLGVSAFWLTSMGTSLGVWVVVGYLVGGLSKERGEEGLDDGVVGDGTEREVKVEGSSSEGLLEPKKEEEADVEDEDEEVDVVGELEGMGRDDSGLGTSLESSAGGSGRLSIRRRKER